MRGKRNEQECPVSISIKATVSSKKVTDARWSRNPKAECDGEVCKVDRERPLSQARGRKALVPAWASHIWEAGRGSLLGGRSLESSAWIGSRANVSEASPSQVSGSSSSLPVLSGVMAFSCHSREVF